MGNLTAINVPCTDLLPGEFHVLSPTGISITPPSMTMNDHLSENNLFSFYGITLPMGLISVTDIVPCYAQIQIIGQILM